jgi:hypothetical protein
MADHDLPIVPNPHRKHVEAAGDVFQAVFGQIALGDLADLGLFEIGRASWRERV